MNSRIQHLINHPFEVQLSDVALLQDEIDKYPYFSTLRSLLLFALKEFEHASYNEELKKTSIYSPSRVALYHYLQKEKQTPVIEELEEEITEQINPEIVETEIRKESETDKEIVAEEKEAELQPEPKIISKDQELTFSQWLSLSKSEDSTKEKPTEKDIKFQLIEEFIEKSPKISPVKISSESTPVIVRNEPFNEYSDLMTETLAQIYTEQKKYEKAIRAYKILSLKYPEKGESFSDKIREIESLRDSK